MTSFVHAMPFGAQPVTDGVRFRLWAPDRSDLALRLERGDAHREIPLTPDAAGWFDTTVTDARPGDRYRWRVGGDLLVPDPASRFQPDDVHGASEVIDPAAYCWQFADWCGRPWEQTVLYEMHIGAFSPQATYAGVADKLDHLVDLGVTAIELMPVADFPGRWDWGYDGVALFAPDSVYGRPEDLKALIDAAHGRGLMVFLDVVYNHFGPEGNYLYVLAREHFFNEQRYTPWGAAINYDGAESRPVRDFVINNVLYWLNEYRFDGLRFDAVDAIDDRSAHHILDEIAERVHAAVEPDRFVHLVLENDRNQARRLERGVDGRPRTYTAQWNDDIHHALHTTLTGEDGGYYVDYAGDPVGHLGRCLAEGFAYQGDASTFRKGERRGEPSAGLPPVAFVDFLQNHDQIGNRAFGERIGALAPPEAVTAATAVVLLAPAVPLLFMGEEWASDRPFQFFCDFGEDLRQPVRDGRRREFASFPEFSDEAARERIPDPLAERTFRDSALDWDEPGREPHRSALALSRWLLALRRAVVVPRLAGVAGHSGRLERRGDRGLTVAWTLGDGAVLTLIAHLGAASGPAPATWPEGDCIFSTHPDVARPANLPAWFVTWFLET